MESKKLTIFFTSDLHAYIYPTDYRSREERDIGLFKCASRFTRDGNTLIIDGGDLLQGSPLGAFCPRYPAKCRPLCRDDELLRLRLCHTGQPRF